MDREKDLLKQDLSKQETAEEINKFIEDTELMGGNEDIVELAKQKLQEISTKADTIEKTSESQISQIENMGGSTEEINNRTGEVDKKIEEVKEGAKEKIEEVQNQEEIKTEVLKTKDIESLKSENLELTLEDKVKEFEGWNNGLVERIDKLNEIIEFSYSEAREVVQKLNEPGISPERKKMLEDSRDFFRAQAEGNNKRELIEAQRQLEKNKKDIETFNTRKEQAKTNLENTEKEVLSLEQDYEKVRTEHKNAVKNRQDDFVLGRIVVELRKKEMLLSDAKIKYSKLKYDYDRNFTKEKS